MHKSINFAHQLPHTTTPVKKNLDFQRKGGERTTKRSPAESAACTKLIKTDLKNAFYYFNGARVARGSAATVPSQVRPWSGNVPCDSFTLEAKSNKYFWSPWVPWRRVSLKKEPHHIMRHSITTEPRSPAMMREPSRNSRDWTKRVEPLKKRPTSCRAP